MRYEKQQELPKNDPALFRPTQCKVLRSFCVGGQPLEVGATITLPWFDANGLRALGKVEVVDR